jgi:nucleotide-binding universal stress UspA family protein
MTAAFHKILIPVDFSVGTEIAVKKAIGLIEKENAVIHLLHVMKPKFFSGFFPRLLPWLSPVRPSEKYAFWKVQKELDQWKETIADHVPGIRVCANIVSGHSVQDMVIRSANLLQPDLVIIGKQGDGRRFSWFHPSISPDYIAKKSNCPLLTAKPGSLHSQTKVIVVPVQDFVPERKLELAILIAKKYRAQVHLVTIRGNSRRKDSAPGQAFIQTYHQLREKLHHPVEYFSSTIHDPARATLDYAQFIMADMILVNPKTESGISSFAGSRHISDLLGRDSKLQVLDVQPY